MKQKDLAVTKAKGTLYSWFKFKEDKVKDLREVMILSNTKK